MLIIANHLLEILVNNQNILFQYVVQSWASMFYCSGQHSNRMFRTKLSTISATLKVPIRGEKLLMVLYIALLCPTLLLTTYHTFC